MNIIHHNLFYYSIKLSIHVIYLTICTYVNIVDSKWLQKSFKRERQFMAELLTNCTRQLQWLCFKYYS